jgi:hypothetical protein
MPETSIVFRSQTGSESMILLERGIGSDINAVIDLLLATAVPEATRLRSVPVGGE